MTAFAPVGSGQQNPTPATPRDSDRAGVPMPSTFADREFVRSMVGNLLEHFHHRLRTAGPEGESPMPILRAFVAGNVLHMPLSRPWSNSIAEVALTQAVLRQLGATAYALALDLRWEVPKDKRSVHVCGGTMSWDMSIGQDYQFKRRDLRIKRTTTGDSDGVRSPVLALIPNLLQARELEGLPQDQQAFAQRYAEDLVAAVRTQIR